MRPTWEEYFLTIAKAVSLRSDDLFIKHGAVITNKQYHIIGTGYNNTVRGFNTSSIDMSDRDGRRSYMQHAEHNACLNSLVNPLNIGGAICYVTGTPCNQCLQTLINFGVDTIYALKRVGSITEDETSLRMKQNLLQYVKYYEIELSE